MKAGGYITWKKLFVILTVFFIAAQIILVFVPVIFAFLWSLVDPEHPWSYPDAFPKSLSLATWRYVFRYTNLFKALATSYSLAPLSSLLAFFLALPTAYVLGRKNFRGKTIISNLILLPIVLPGMVVALFLSRVFAVFGLTQSFPGLILGHCLMGIPYMIRILATSFSSIPQDVIDAAENLGAGMRSKICHVFIPMVLPGLFAGTIFTFITSLEEFNLTYIIGTPTFETIPTILYSFLGYHFIRTNAAVVAIVLMIPNIVMLIIAERLMKTDYLSASLGKM
ncbi:MAG: ABC transporter permease [Treponemataceae bacterium]|jgi:putative spermidine/putrescine transport system permease protein|nr:MAG: ABC transporter permease [Treponemataceae bacterium]